MNLRTRLQSLKARATRPALGLTIGVVTAVAAVAAVAAWENLMEQRKAAQQAAMVAEWNRRPIVYICEPRPGERIILGCDEPTGPDAKPDAEPRQIILQAPDCETEPLLRPTGWHARE